MARSPFASSVALLVGALGLGTAGAQEPVFTDGFESGSNCVWSSAQPDAATPIGFKPIVDRTTDGSNAMAATCTGAGSREKVFVVAIPNAGIVSATLMPTGDADLGIALRHGCAVEDEFACSDLVGPGNTEIVQVELGAAQLLYVLVDGFDGSEGEFELDIDFADCGNGVSETGEECDDGDLDETDGCTSECSSAAVCTVAAVPGGDRFEVDPASGHCYVAFDDEASTFADADASCANAGGHLVTITSASELSHVAAVRNASQVTWIGASDENVEGSFEWVTGEPFAFTSWVAGEPDDDIGTGGSGDCVALEAASGDWLDTSCTFVGFVSARICEREP